MPFKSLFRRKLGDRVALVVVVGSQLHQPTPMVSFLNYGQSEHECRLIVKGASSPANA